MSRKNNGYLLPETVEGHALTCVSFKIPDVREFRSAVAGTLFELCKWWNWERTADKRGTVAASLMRQLLHDTLRFDCASELPPDGDCIEYQTDASIIEWLPRNPFLQPNDVPAGYLLPPFQVVTTDNLLLFVGYQTGDVLTDILRFPAGTPVLTEPTSGWARFRVSATGTGVVELHLLNVPLGGYALVQLDENILFTSLVELNLDLTAVPPEANQVIVHEVVIDTDGNHVIDVTFVPRVNDEVPFVYYGGGLRKIVLCGFDQAQGDAMFDVRQNDTSRCVLEKTSDGETWQQFADLSLCRPNVRVRDGVIEWLDGDTWVEIPNQDPRELPEPDPYPDGYLNPGVDARCVSAKNIAVAYTDFFANMHAQLMQGANLTAIAAVASAAWTLVFPGAGHIAVAALSISASLLEAGANKVNELLQPHEVDYFTCAVYDATDATGRVTASGFSTLRSVMSAHHTDAIKRLIVEQYLDALGASGLTRQAKYAGITDAECSCVTSDCWNYSSANNPAQLTASMTTFQVLTADVTPVTNVTHKKLGAWQANTGVVTTKRSLSGTLDWEMGMSIWTCADEPSTRQVRVTIRNLSAWNATLQLYLRVHCRRYDNGVWETTPAQQLITMPAANSVTVNTLNPAVVNGAVEMFITLHRQASYSTIAAQPTFSVEKVELI